MKKTIVGLLENAFYSKASDLHIIVDSPPVLRINGKLQPVGSYPLSRTDTEQMAKEIIPEQLWNEFVTKGEVDFNYELESTSRFRLNAFRQRDSISIAIRTIPTKIPSISELNMPKTLESLMENPQGLILVTGPTGSGKSTTLAAMIDYINQKYAKHIITLEDPIEYVHSHKKSIVNQREVGADTLSFANGLRAALRQDPDIILVGEMRDLETISTAITAAETGHLVLATLHTSSAAQTIDRIIDVFQPHQQRQVRLQVANVLKGVISQRLFPLKDGSGRVAATEILINTPSVANLIRNEKIHQIQNVLQTSRAQGMHTLEMSIQGLLSTGKITYESALPYMNTGDLNGRL
ncbi:type IV pilus twitching motility protein PilT [Pallidibacillus pasinlerensis]|uniref:Type IV pilus twitching motility protein PilT n=1 Tax=Pallidibacillus pasinlerensis TaxID=2703818 RepID=A0ABX0A372_9BACI|nr:type IV pilus twitching motility protein PilT [Pallidibacillus pasinlerensis]NCU16941.1 type IV pilus twitching motility protein PilT [Pallidibacillus pasinlerensis]